MGRHYMSICLCYYYRQIKTRGGVKEKYERTKRNWIWQKWQGEEVVKLWDAVWEWEF